MQVKDILAKIATRPAKDVLKITDWLLAKAETHWAEETNKHQEATNLYKGTSMGEKASAAYQEAFVNWHTIRQVRARLQQPVRSLGTTLKVAA